MKKLAVIAACAATANVFAIGGNPNVRFSPQSGGFPLIAKGVPALVVVDSADWPGVARAARDLQGDLERVSGSGSKYQAKTPRILVGTLGRSPTIDGLVKDGVLNVDAVRGQWEASVTQVVNVPKVGRCLVVAGADKRGTIYALYDLSQAVGVSPWYWWQDVPIKKHANAFVSGRYVAKSPVVKYRGIFLNDEAPSLSNWVYANFGDYRHGFYEKIFELLLRLRANYLWPAMWNNSFSVDDPLNPKLADEYGIVMGTSHVEPMMRADKEWNRLGFTERQWNYGTNPAELEKFWRDGVVRNKPYENIVTIAMRGKVDTPMSESANIALLEKIVASQRKILAESVNPDVTQIPQLWCLYKEVQEYYEKGMRVPDDVTLLWADDNWGDIRRLPTPEERRRPGGAGVYYHFDYVGGPRNYKWIDTNPIPKVWEQMNLAHKYGADRIWIVNVGDMKPKPFATEFFLNMARDPDAIRKEDLTAYGVQWAAREFGAKEAKEIAHIITETARLNGRRKPELVGPETYSLVNYNEAERVAGEFHSLYERAEKVAARLPAEYQPAFYQIVTHTIKAPMVVNDLYTAAAKNALYAQQGRAATNDEADRVKALFAKDAEITNEYHTVNGGKWNHFMDQTHIGYTTWQQPDKNNIPRTKKIEVPATSDMGVAVEGSTSSWPGSTVFPRLVFGLFGQPTRTFEVFNRGSQPFACRVQGNVPWLKIGDESGKATFVVNKQTTVRVQFNPAGLDFGDHTAMIHVSGSGKDLIVYVVATVPLGFERVALDSFVEGDRVVAIEAEHTSRRVPAKGVKWETIPRYGRRLSAVEPFPVEFKPFEPGEGPCLEYNLTTFSEGKFGVEVVVSPSLAFQPTHGLRLAIAFDDKKPQVIDVAPKYLSRDWEQAVSDSVKHVRSEHILLPGKHKLKIWAIDPAVVVERIVVNLGGLKQSYLGPPESKRGRDLRL